MSVISVITYVIGKTIDPMLMGIAALSCWQLTAVFGKL